MDTFLLGWADDNVFEEEIAVARLADYSKGSLLEEWKPAEIYIHLAINLANHIKLYFLKVCSRSHNFSNII